MSYKGPNFTYPLVAPGLGYLRNSLIVPPGIMENIRNCNIHELGAGKRGGTFKFPSVGIFASGNGGFEEGDFTGWTANNSAISAIISGIDEDCSSLSGYAITGTGGGSVAEVNPAGQFHIKDVNTAFTSIAKDWGSIDSDYTFSIRTKFENDNTREQLELFIGSSVNYLNVQFSNVGIQVRDSVTDVLIAGSNVHFDLGWHTWKFNVFNEASVDIYKDGLLVYSGVVCDAPLSGSVVNGTTAFTCHGSAGDPSECYIDWHNVTEPVYSGSYSSKLEASGSALTGAISDVFTIDPVIDYSIILYYFVTEYTAGTAEIEMVFNDGSVTTVDIVSATAATNTWTQLTYTFGPNGTTVIPSDATTVTFQQKWTGTATGVFFIDDFSIPTSNSRVTGLKQFVSPKGINRTLRATAEGILWNGLGSQIKTGLATKGDEILAENTFQTHAKWNVSGDFDDTGGELDYTHNTNVGTATQTKANFLIALKASTEYEVGYILISDTTVGDVAINITTGVASVSTALTIAVGSATTRFTTNSNPGDFVLSGTSSSGDVQFTLLSLKEVIAYPVDISNYLKTAVFTNGRDIPQVYTGLTVLDFPDSPIPGLVEDTAGIITNGKHSYKITFVNGSGETTGSEASIEVDVVDNTIEGQILLSNIDIGPNEVTSRKLYRTAAGGTIYKLLATLSDNFTDTYTDNIADGSLGANLPTDNTATTGTTTTDLGIDGIARPDAPTVALAGPDAPNAHLHTAPGNVDNGAHSYILTFVDADLVESTGGPKSNVVTVVDKASEGQINLFQIPIGPTGTTARKIYRTLAGDTGEYYHVATISGNSTISYVDNIADNSLGTSQILLNNADFTAHAHWDVTGDFDDTGGNAQYTHNTGVGTLVQILGNMIIAPIPGARYSFTYTVSGSGGDADAEVTTDFAATATALTISDGTHTTVLIASDSATSFFKISSTSSAGGFTLDNVALTLIPSDGSGMDAGTHTYRLTFENVHGETIGGTTSLTITATAENGQINLTTIPLGGLGINSRKIYRTAAGGTQHKLLTVLGDNTTTTYLDKKLDSDLGDNIPTSNTAAARPSDWTGTNNPKYAFEHASGNTEGIVFFGCEDNLDTIYIIPDGTENASDANIKQFTFQTKSLRGKNVLVGGREYGENLFMFSQDSAWLIDKSDLDSINWTYIKAPWKGGTINNKTIVAVNNDLHCMEPDGNIYSVKRVQESGNTSLASLTRPTLNRPHGVDRWIKDNIDLDYSADFHGIFDEELQAVLWFMVRKGQTQIDTALTYFVNFDRWVIMDNRDFVSGFSASVSTVVTNDNGTKTISTGGYGGDIWYLNQISKNDDGNGYWAGFKLHPISLPSSNIIEMKSYDRIFIVQEINEGVNLIVEGFIDNVSTGQESIESATKYTNYSMKKGTGREIALEIYNETANEDFFLMGLIFYYEIYEAPSE